MGIKCLTIRQAELRDCAALAALIEELGYQVMAEEVAARLPLLSGAGCATLVGELDGRVAGCLTTSIMHVLHRPAPVGRVSMFVVSESLRGKDIGRRLLAEACRQLAAAGCRLVEVTSNLRRADAHAFYEHLGWERTSLRFAMEVGPEQIALPGDGCSTWIEASRKE